MRRFPRTLLLCVACAGSVSTALAQSDPAPVTSAAGKSSAGKPAARKKSASAKPAGHKPDPYQSPLATIMQSHLWTTVPEAQDFVRDSRPAPKDLKYTPLQNQLGPDPVRPKPRDPANVMALQAEMEASIAHNQGRVGRSNAKPHRTKANAAAE